MTGTLALVCGLGARTLTASVNPTSVSGSYNGASASEQDITTSSVLAEGQGGSTPYTFAWSQVGSSPYNWIIDAPTSATTSFMAETVGSGERAQASFRCVVTDANAISVATLEVSATANNNSTA